MGIMLDQVMGLGIQMVPEMAERMGHGINLV